MSQVEPSLDHGGILFSYQQVILAEFDRFETQLLAAVDFLAATHHVVRPHSALGVRLVY